MRKDGEGVTRGQGGIRGMAEGRNGGDRSLVSFCFVRRDAEMRLCVSCGIDLNPLFYFIFWDGEGMEEERDIGKE